MITLVYPDPRVAAEVRGGADWFRGDAQAPKIKGHKVTYRHYKTAKWKREWGTYTKRRELMRLKY